MWWPQLSGQPRNGNPATKISPLGDAVGWVKSLYKVESVVFAVMLMEMLNQDSTKTEENMEKESLLHNISQGSNLPSSRFFCEIGIFDLEKSQVK